MIASDADCTYACFSIFIFVRIFSILLLATRMNSNDNETMLNSSRNVGGRENYDESVVDGGWCDCDDCMCIVTSNKS